MIHLGFGGSKSNTYDTYSWVCVSVDNFLNLIQLENSKVDVQGVSLKRGYTESAPDPKGSAVHPGRLSVQRIYVFVPEGPKQNVDYSEAGMRTVCHCQQNEPTSCESVSLSSDAKFVSYQRWASALPRKTRCCHICRGEVYSCNRLHFVRLSNVRFEPDCCLTFNAGEESPISIECQLKRYKTDLRKTELTVLICKICTDEHTTLQKKKRWRWRWKGISAW